jgi:Protein of unknown function (DUF4012)
VAGCALLVIAAVCWLGIRGYLARNHLERARPGVTAIRDALVAGDTAGAANRLRDVQRDTRAGRRLTSDPVWALAAHTPYLGATLRTTAGLTAAVDTIAQSALPGLVTAGDALAPAKLRRGGSDIDLSLVAQARDPLQRADTTITDASARVAALPTRGVLGVVTRARTQLTAQLDSVRGQVHDASLAAQLLPPMLGADGPRRYFLAMQNNAESRATGGLLAAYGILEADHGALKLVKMGSNSDLPQLTATAQDAGVPADYVARYRDWGLLGPTWHMGNLSPHFPYAAQIWAARWRAATGESVDGSIALDPATLSYLLAVTGPVTIADGTVLGADNVVDFLLRDEYARFPGNEPQDREERKQFQVGVAQGVIQRILSGDGSARELASALGRAAGQRRLLLATPAHPVEQALLAGTPIGGVLPDSPQPMAGLVVNGAGGYKLDYYLQRRLVYSANSCTAGRRPVTAVITLTNTAPPSGLPEFVVNGDGAPAGSFVPGRNRVWVSYYATPGAGLDRAMIDGLPLRVVADTERRHPVFSAYVDIDPQTTRTITLSLSEPATAGPVLTPVQPLVLPQETRVASSTC